jgi:quercetin dioxygenase-like cupin family protein
MLTSPLVQPRKNQERTKKEPRKNQPERLPEKEKRHMENPISRSNAGLLAPGAPVVLSALLEYQEGAVVSRTLLKGEKGTVTLFAFDAGQGLSEHSAPFDAFVQVLDGETALTIGGKEVLARAGQSIVMPAGIPHALHATTRMKMLLTMIRG